MELDGQVGLFADNPAYDAFVDKFKRKKTTDDCFTPPLVYDAVRDWACAEYGIDPARIVRPFWPDTDYRRFDYPDGCVVLDNPPFSILTPICEFYLARSIPFFLFAPALTCMSNRNVTMSTTHVFGCCHIVYENGASVNTAFVTSLGGDIIAMSSPSLYRAVKVAVDATARQFKPSLPKYDYPDHVLTASMLGTMARFGEAFAVRARDCSRVSVLDAQRPHGKAIFGGGLLLSDRAAERSCCGGEGCGGEGCGGEGCGGCLGAIAARKANRRRTWRRGLNERHKRHWHGDASGADRRGTDGPGAGGEGGSGRYHRTSL